MTIVDVKAEALLDVILVVMTVVEPSSSVEEEGEEGGAVVLEVSTNESLEEDDAGVDVEL